MTIRKSEFHIIYVMALIYRNNGFVQQIALQTN